MNLEKLAQLKDLHLNASSHPNGFDTGHCAMELVSWLADEPFSDHPVCACRVIGSTIISWQDGMPDDETRDKWVKPVLEKVLNTHVADDSVLLKRMYLVMDWHIRVRTPIFLRAAGSVKEAESIEALPEVVDEKSLRFTEVTLIAASSALWISASSAAQNAAESAASSAAQKAASRAAQKAAWSAASSAAWGAAWSAAQNAAQNAAWSAALAPAVEECHRTLQGVVLRMCEVGR